MKYSIITPTFQPHFKYVAKYLRSFEKYVTDKNSIEIIFTISRKEEAKFYKIIRKYKKINIKVLCFEDILSKFNISESPDSLLHKYKKFTFQTLKKFYTMLYSDADYFLVLDSESMWIRKTNMEELFQNFFSAPFITYSSPSDRDYFDIFSKCVRENTDYLLGKKCDKWFLENFVWFYDKKILNDLFSDYGTPIQFAEKIYSLGDPFRIEWGIFEIELYQVFIYMNNDKYNYKLLDAGSLLKSELTKKEYEIYRKSFIEQFDGGCGILERTTSLLTKSNIEILAKIFKDNNFSVIRCDESNERNYKLQSLFIKMAEPNILAASQGHCFGINNHFLTLLRNNNNCRNAYKTLMSFYLRIKNTLLILLLKDILKFFYFSFRAVVGILIHFKSYIH